MVQKTLRLSDVFRGYRKATKGCSGLIEYNVRNIVLQKKQAENEEKQAVSTLVFNILIDLDLNIKVKTNFITFQTVDLEIWSILIFYKRVWD